MFRSLWVYHQEGGLCVQFCKVCFSCIFVSSLAVGRVFSNTFFQLLDLKSENFFALRHSVASQCTVQGTQNIRLQHAMTFGVWSFLIFRNWYLACPDVFLSTLSCFVLSLYSSYCLSILESLTRKFYWIIIIIHVDVSYFLDLVFYCYIERGCAIGWGTALQVGRSRVRFPMSLEFFTDIILLAALWPWGWLSL
jgi:hypothetical protein